MTARRWLAAIVAVMIGVWGSAQTATAAIDVYDWELIHMDVDNGQNATDLHFTLFQQEHKIEVLGWDYILKQRAADGGQIIAQDDGDTGLHDDDVYRAGRGWQTNDTNHAADVEITGLNIPYCTRLWLKTSLHLSSWNTLRKRELTWTFDENPEPAPPDDGGLPPDEGFIWTNYQPDPINAGRWKVTYTITNDDPTRWFRVSDLQFLLDSANVPIDDPEAMMNWPGWFAYAGPTFDLAPRTELSIVLDNLTIQNWLYAKLVKQEITGQGGAVVGDPVPTVQIHETPEPASLVLITLGGLMMLHRRRR